MVRLYKTKPSYSDAIAQLGASDLQSAIEALDTRLDDFPINQRTNLTFYLDSINGDDANDGLSLATAFKTLTAGLGVVRNKYKFWLGNVIFNVVEGSPIIGEGYRPITPPEGAYSITIQGNESNPSSTQCIDTTLVFGTSLILLRIRGIEFVADTINPSFGFLYTDGSCLVQLRNCNYRKNPTLAHSSGIRITRRTLCLLEGNHRFYEGNYTPFTLSNSYLETAGGLRIESNFSGNFFVVAGEFSQAIINSTITQTGVFTGTKFRCQSNSSLKIRTAFDLNALPGTIEGYFGLTNNSGLVSGSYNGVDFADIVDRKTITQNVVLLPNSYRNLDYTISAPFDITLPSTNLDYPYRFKVHNNIASTSSLSLKTGTTTLAVIQPGQTAIAENSGTTTWKTFIEASYLQLEAQRLIESGAINLQSVFPAPIPASMTLSWAGGQFKFANRGVQNLVILSAIATISYSLYNPDGGSISSGNTSFNFNRYWSGSAIATPSNANFATIQFLYLKYDGTFHLVLGQYDYSALSWAVSAGENAESKRLPNVLNNSDYLYLCAIAGKANATDISQGNPETGQVVLMYKGV